MADIVVNYVPNSKQVIFHSCGASEAVYGGAKGGGKSCALVMEALAYALEHAKANMYLFRETYDDLEANLIREWIDKVPKELYSYNNSKHMATLLNGSTIKFRYISNYIDSCKYQGRSMDWIGVDELTNFEERSIQELLSCLRSPLGFPPLFRGTCNPGGIGHEWVKRRYILGTNYGANVIMDAVTGSSIAFIPASSYDNTVLMENDPAYLRRLENLPEVKRKAFLLGEWDIFVGQYFGEWRRDVHVVAPFVIPSNWRRYVSFDYGFDMLAVYWFAVDEHMRAYCYREYCNGKDNGVEGEDGLIISEAAKVIKELSGEEVITAYLAPPDLFNKRQETGKSVADIFARHGMYLSITSNERVAGWLAVKEWIKPITDVDGSIISKLSFFSNVVKICEWLPLLQHDAKNINDVSGSPHNITHGPDAIRGFCIYWASPGRKEDTRTELQKYRDDVLNGKNKKNRRFW